MRHALIPFLSGLVILSSPIIDDRSDPISLVDEDSEPDLENYDENDATSDFELPSHSPQFDHAHLPVVYRPPTRSSLTPRALVSVVANANSSTFVDAQSLAVTAAGGGKSTGKSKTSADPVGYRYLGCYTDAGGAPGDRTLRGKRAVVPQLTKEICQATCGVWPYYGMEYSTECYCGGAILNGGIKVDDDNCSTACAGNPSQTCGGPGHMSIYYDPAVAGPSDPPTFNGAALLGCYNEMYPLRVLDNGGTNSDMAMTLTLCSEYCYGLVAPQPMMHWGLEGGKDCWCGIDINSSATLAPDLNYCGMACTGNEMQLCGGSNLIAVYHKI